MDTFGLGRDWHEKSQEGGCWVWKNACLILF